MKPLCWPDFYQSKLDKPRSLWGRLPIIGGWFSCHDDYKAVIGDINAQLGARSKPSASVWGNEPGRIEMAQYLCSILKEEYGWANDYFIPDDPFAIVFQIPWDDLEIVEIIMRIEEELGFELKDEEVETWGGTLGNVVDFLVAKRRQMTQADTWK